MSDNQERFERLFDNQMSVDEARGFLIELYESGESASDIATAASIMRDHSIKLPISSELQDRAVDIVGTGGDKSEAQLIY